MIRRREKTEEKYARAAPGRRTRASQKTVLEMEIDEDGGGVY